MRVAHFLFIELPTVLRNNLLQKKMRINVNQQIKYKITHVLICQIAVYILFLT